MSHFAVLVIGADVEKQLAPYQENNMGDCPKEYLEFNNVEAELKETYDDPEETISTVVGPRGGFHSPYDEKFRNKNYKPFDPAGDTNKQYLIPEGYTLKEIPVKERFTFDEYAKDYNGYTKDPEKAAFGYWENPNKKWDWYQAGGRYSGRLQLKNGERVNECKVGELDLEGMRASRIKQRTEIWESIEAIKDEDKKNFEMMLQGMEPGLTREEYIGDEALSVYAVVKNGEWFGKGQMGWFGMSSDKVDAATWRTTLTDLMKDLDPETELTVVDCHI